MTEHRRAFIAGGTYFFTVNLADRRQSLLTEHIGSYEPPFVTRAGAILSSLRPWWCFPIIYTHFGHCRMVMRTFPSAGDCSRPPFHAVCLRMKPSHKADCAKASAAFGSDAIGSTRYGTRMISIATSTTSTSIRSSTGMPRGLAIGRIRHFEWRALAFTRAAGPPIQASRWAILASDKRY
jgi:hypothetical protein